MRVSIVMPVKNAGSWLADTLASISNQTLRDFELVAINDHSVDESADILSSWATRDARIVVVQNPGSGLVSALNTGISVVRAPLIARMDADDLMPPERLALQEEFLSVNSDATLVSGRVEHWGDATTAGYSRYVDFLNSIQTPEEFRHRQFVESPLAHPSVMIRRDALPQRPYRDGDFPEDYDLWLRLLAGGAQFHSIPQVVLRWRDHALRTSRVDPRYDVENFYRHKATFIADWLRARGHDSVVAWAGGRRTRRRIDALRQAGIVVDSYIDIHPRRVGQRIGGVPVVAPETFIKTGGGFILVYVGAPGARAAIAGWLEGQGLREGKHYLCAA